jgi:hypothetical protein
VCWKPCSSCRSLHLLRKEFLSAPIHSPLSGLPYRSFKWYQSPHLTLPRRALAAHISRSPTMRSLPTSHAPPSRALCPHLTLPHRALSAHISRSAAAQSPSRSHAPRRATTCLPWHRGSTPGHSRNSRLSCGQTSLAESLRHRSSQWTASASYVSPARACSTPAVIETPVGS